MKSRMALKFLKLGILAILLLVLFWQLFLRYSGKVGEVATAREASPRVVLEVINKHFTVGRKIPSVYLRVFSDGTAECHTVRYTGDEPNVVKKKALTPGELGKLEAVLDNQDLLNVNKTYELVNPVIDSWMEWNITVPHKIATQKIQVLNFSPGSAGEKNKPYPDALVRLGCHIWKLRFEIYGDEIYGNKPYYLADGCKNAFASLINDKPGGVSITDGHFLECAEHQKRVRYILLGVDCGVEVSF